MKTSPLLASIATLSSVAAATADFDPKIHRITQVSTGPCLKNGAVAVAAAFRKYGYEPPDDVKLAAETASKGEKGQVGASSYGGGYVSPVHIGSQTLMLPVSNRAGHTAYKCTNPKLPGETWNITYSGGSSAHGNIVHDKVIVGGVTAPNQAVMCAKLVSSGLNSLKAIDGILGLGFMNANTAKPKKVNTFFANIRGQLAAPLFTATLKKGKPGEYDLGYINATKHTGNVVYSQINSASGYWEFTTGGFAVGTGSEVVGPITIVADTGTPIILTSDSIAQEYYAEVSGAYYNSTYGGYIFPCNEVIPSFSLYIDGVRRTTPGAYLVYAAVSASMCYGGIQAQASLPFSVFGLSFLQSQFVVFDVGVPRIGFAPQKGVP